MAIDLSTRIGAVIRAAVSLPLWVKTSGQSERVPTLAAAAFDARADAVIMAGRLLGFVADVETFKLLFGINGAQSGLDVARFMLAGASAVEIASPVMVHGFRLLSDAVAEFGHYVERKGVAARDLIGVAADQHRTFMEMPRMPDNWRNYVPADSLD